MFQQTSPVSFPLYGSLPQEIQDLIWELAYWPTMVEMDTTHIEPSSDLVRVRFKPPMPAVALVCARSRTAILRLGYVKLVDFKMSIRGYVDLDRDSICWADTIGRQPSRLSNGQYLDDNAHPAWRMLCFQYRGYLQRERKHLVLTCYVNNRFILTQGRRELKLACNDGSCYLSVLQ